MLVASLVVASVLAQSFQPQPSPWDDGQSVAAPLGLARFASMGSASYPASIPAPTIDCVAAASGGELTCVGATATKAGNPTTVSSATWYEGDTDWRPAVRLDGTGDYYDLGAVGSQTGSFSVSLSLAPTDLAVNYEVFGKYDEVTSKGFTILVLNDGRILAVIRDASSVAGTIFSTSTLVPGSWSVVTLAYEFVAAGTSKWRMVINGVAQTESTGLVGPPTAVANSLFVGKSTASGAPLKGNSRRASVWTGVAFSAAELLLVNASQTGLTLDKPAATVATHTRVDSTLCCAFTESSCQWIGPNAPCIHAPTYSGSLGGAGLEVYSLGANLLAYSRPNDADTWVAYAPGHTAPTKTSNSADVTDPVGTNTATKVEFPAVGSGKISILVAPQVAQTAIPYTFGIWARTLSGTFRTHLACYSSAYYAIKEIAVTSTWQRLTTTGTSPGSAAQSCHIGTDLNTPAAGETATDAGTVYLYLGTMTATSAPIQARATSGLAYAAASGTVASEASTVTDYTRWAYAVRATPGGAGWGRTDTIGLWQWGGSYGTANSATAYIDSASKPVVEIYDGAAGWKRWTAGAALTGTASKSIAVQYQSGTIRVWVEGVEVAGTMSGAGTGLLAALPTATIGLGVTGSSVLQGTVGPVCQGKSYNAVKGCVR